LKVLACIDVDLGGKALHLRDCGCRDFPGRVGLAGPKMP